MDTAIKNSEIVKENVLKELRGILSSCSTRREIAVYSRKLMKDVLEKDIISKKELLGLFREVFENELTTCGKPVSYWRKKFLVG